MFSRIDGLVLLVIMIALALIVAPMTVDVLAGVLSSCRKPKP